MTNEQLLTRRQVLAFITLTDAPVPEQINFLSHDEGKSLHLAFNRGSEVHAWAAVLAEPADVLWLANGKPTTDGRFYYNAAMDWHGYRVSLSALDKPGTDRGPAGELYEDVVDALQDLVEQDFPEEGPRDQALVDEAEAGPAAADQAEDPPPADVAAEDCCPGAGEVYEREDPETGAPPPAGVVLTALGGRPR